MKAQIDLAYPGLELGYQRFDCPQSGLEVSVSAKLNRQSPKRISAWHDRKIRRRGRSRSNDDVSAERRCRSNGNVKVRSRSNVNLDLDLTLDLDVRSKLI